MEVLPIKVMYGLYRTKPSMTTTYTFHLCLTPSQFMPRTATKPSSDMLSLPKRPRNTTTGRPSTSCSDATAFTDDAAQAEKLRLEKEQKARNQRRYYQK
jgi:hypothetical protein